MVEGPCKRCTRVTDGDGDEFHPPPILMEGRNEGEYFSCFLSHPRSRENSIPMTMRVHNFFWVEVGLAGAGRVWDSSRVYEV